MMGRKKPHKLAGRPCGRYDRDSSQEQGSYCLIPHRRPRIILFKLKRPEEKDETKNGRVHFPFRQRLAESPHCWKRRRASPLK